MDERGQKGYDAHEEKGQRPEARVRNLLVQQHEQRQRQADCSSQASPAESKVQLVYAAGSNQS
ncbi:hypothetical protein ACSTLG_00235, partial [Vibrio parahaemolyticus]